MPAQFLVVVARGEALGVDGGDDRPDVAPHVGAAGGRVLVGGRDQRLQRQVECFVAVERVAEAELGDGGGVQEPEPEVA
jgi:hypothetical protein